MNFRVIENRSITKRNQISGKTFQNFESTYETDQTQDIEKEIKEAITSQKWMSDQFGLENDKVLYDDFGNPRWLEFVKSDYGWVYQRKNSKIPKNTSIKIESMINRQKFLRSRNNKFREFTR